MRFHYIITIVLILLYTSILAYASSPQSNNSDFLIFEDPVLGVKFEYTDEWIRQGSFLYGAESECTSLPCVRLPEVSVSTFPIAFEDFSLENYTKQERLYHEDITRYKPIALNETKIGDGKDAFQYVYSTTSPLLTKDDKIINHEIYTTEGINLYKVTFTALQDEQYDKYLNSFKKMMDTFEIIR